MNSLLEISQGNNAGGKTRGKNGVENPNRKKKDPVEALFAINNPSSNHRAEHPKRNQGVYSDDEEEEKGAKPPGHNQVNEVRRPLDFTDDIRYGDEKRQLEIIKQEQEGICPEELPKCLNFGF